MRKKLLLFIGLSAVLSLNAQDTKMYKSIVEDLCKEKYHGRGYVMDGVRKAEEYLCRQYTKAGADTVILQEFSIDINTFPGKAEMSVDGKKLSPGKDFVMREYSPGIHGTFPLYYVDTLNYDFARITEDLAKPENKGCLVVSDFWFTYRHKQDFRSLEKKGEHKNAGVLYIWNTPLKFYKAYGEKVVEKPIVWCSPDFPKDAKNVQVDIDNKFLEGYKCNNVIAKVEGRRHDSTFVFIAHYDHLGHFGDKLFFPGANDNASGNAALVTLAKHYSENRPEFDILFLSVAGEEANLRGSTFFAEHPLVPLDRIKYLIDLDMIGDDNPVQYCEASQSGDAGFRLFEIINSQYSLFDSLRRGELAANSDHYPFAERGVPCIFFENESGSAFPFYHTAQDDMTHFVSCTYEKIFKLVTEFINKY